MCLFVIEARGSHHITVAADGSGDFKTVQQALDHVPDNNNQPVVIKIKSGIYQEQIRVVTGKRHVTLRGEDPQNTVLTFKLSALQAGNTRLAFSTLINGDDFRAENLTFENTFGTGSQAVALFVDAERASFENCRFLGWQDTLFVNGSRHYFKNCYVEGHVDFIFGTASAVFEDCTIHSKGQGYVTAHYRLSNEENTGFVFLRCRLTGQDTSNGVYLGRPWRPYARVVFLDCWLGPHIRPEGWDNWRDPAREKTAWFGEYRSKGPGANPKARVAWSRQLTSAEAATFSRAQFFSHPVRGLYGKANQAVGTIAWADAHSKADEWYASAEALRIADNVVLYQRNSGGWPKNIDMGKPFDESERPALLAQKKENDSTIDNGATYTQLSFLARVYTKHPQERHREVFLKGFDFLLQAQYPNGGWPQFYPDLSGYYKHITYNDDAMIGVLKLLRDVAAAKPNYTFVDEARRAKAASAVARGIDCILKTQVIVNGHRTVWCAQHDEVTFAPAPARKFEVASLSGGESVGIVRFLMSLKEPSPAVVDAIQSAMAWFEQTQLKGIKWIERTDASQPGGIDRVVVKDPEAGPIWARFYEIGTNRPVFVGRDAVVKYSVAEIEHERRVGYAWYVEEPAKLLKDEYPKWRVKQTDR
ncbi:MAG TPA: pectate lyase [Pyrinomonadaceae bacterium]|nr:pectate lyase [Pyrinomonadaceae bacterium]